jgi:hypothetical protein
MMLIFVCRTAWLAVTRVLQSAHKRMQVPVEDVLHVPRRSPAAGEYQADAHQRCFDAVLVSKLDRFGRPLRHLGNALAESESLGVAFVSEGDDLDLSTPPGRLMFQDIGAMAELERSLIVEGVRLARCFGILVVFSLRLNLSATKCARRRANVSREYAGFEFPELPTGSDDPRIHPPNAQAEATHAFIRDFGGYSASSPCRSRTGSSHRRANEACNGKPTLDRGSSDATTLTIQRNQKLTLNFVGRVRADHL